MHQGLEPASLCEAVPRQNNNRFMAAKPLRQKPTQRSRPRVDLQSDKVSMYVASLGEQALSEGHHHSAMALTYGEEGLNLHQ